MGGAKKVSIGFIATIVTALLVSGFGAIGYALFQFKFQSCQQKVGDVCVAVAPSTPFPLAIK